MVKVATRIAIAKASSKVGRQFGFSLRVDCGLLVQVIRVVRALAFLGLTVTSHVAFAEDVVLDYAVPAGCPSREHFESQVIARTALVRFVQTPRSGRFFSVYVESNSTGPVGRLTTGRDREVGSAREVSSQSCEDVIAALALIAALAVDPNASLAAILPPSAAFPVELPASASLPAAVQDVLAPTVSPNFPPPSNGAQSGVPLMSHDWPRQAASRAISFEVGAMMGGSLWLTSPAVPWGAFGGTIGVENARPSSDAAFVQFSVTYAKSATVNTNDAASAHFESWMFGLDNCPLRWKLGFGVVLRPCAQLEGGRLTGTGLSGGSIGRTRSGNRFSGAIAESVRLQFPLGGGWRLVAEPGVSEPFWHDKFVFDTPAGQVRLGKVPTLVPRLSLGLSVRFW